MGAQADKRDIRRMKYIIMCGGEYPMWSTPKQMTEVQGEPLVARTIRLLREAGAKDIAISTNNLAFKKFGVKILYHQNDYVSEAYNRCKGYWCNCFYPTEDPCCYLFGDVLFSPKAIKTIVETDTDDIMLFGSKNPFAKEYPKPYIEPFAFKVVNQKHLHEACEELKQLDRLGVFKRRPIAWELWSVIKHTAPNKTNWTYTAINDYTCDIDIPEEIEQVTALL